MVEPGLQGVEVTALSRDGKLRLPPIIGLRFHRNFVPIGLSCGTMSQNGVQDVVTVGENVRRHHHAITDRAFDGKSSTINLRLDVLDDYPAGKRGRIALFSSPVIRGTDLPALISRPLVKDRRGASRTRDVRKH